jgi:hypothetical protein
MNPTIFRRLASAPCLALLAAAAFAQSNVIPGTDVSLGILGPMKYWGHTGTFPNGEAGFSMETTSCNLGTVDVPWLAPMQSNHPTISFMVVRLSGDRLVQVSDWSYVKHGFFALSNSQCTPCQNSSNGTFLGVGCSDTYSVNNNGDNYYLAPPSEVDPWLNTWTPQCSHFDKGEPPVGSPQDCDGVRSLTSTQAGNIGPVNHRMVVRDGEINVAGAQYYYQGQYNIRGEPEASRTNNLGSRQCTFSWNGSSWSVGTSGILLPGSVLQRWTGASLSSNTNGGDDGRLYVAVKTTPAGANTHYEYAVHNRDNKRGVGALRIPIAPGAVVTNFGFRDLDTNSANNWSMVVNANEIVVSTTGNPIQWNTIYNFWFDCNVAPAPVALKLDQFGAGGGQPFVTVNSSGPGTSGCASPSVYCTSKVSSSGCVPVIASSGQPSLSNPGGFTVSANGLEINQNGIQFFGTSGPDTLPFQDGTLCVLSPLYRLAIKNSGGAASCSGSFSYTLADLLAHPSGGPLVVAGQQINQQGWFRDPPAASTTGLTNGLQYVVCP